MSDERGAVSVVVALLLVALIGMGALVIDVGAAYAERRELQNGADAAALGIAEDCARGVIACTVASLTNLDDRADLYADPNASDDSADAAVDPTDFDPTGRVTVRTSTRDGDTAGTTVQFVFAPILSMVSEGDFDGRTMTARATARWGSPVDLKSIPLTISTCEYGASQAAGLLGQVPPFTTANEVTLGFHAGSGGGSTCAAEAGHDTDGDGKLPAGFGWLVRDAACRVVTSTVAGQDWVSKDPGNATADGGSGCSVAQLAEVMRTEVLGKVVGVPVFDDLCRTQNASCPTFDNRDKYRIARYAGFHVTGYKLSGDPEWQRYDGVYRTSVPSCSGPGGTCITGFFTTAVVQNARIGGPRGSAVVIELLH